jgi:hypothetical protein
MKYFTQRQLLTHIVFLVLLALRIPVADLVSNFLQLFHISILPSWMEGLRLIQQWTFYFWENGSFVFVGAIIVVNRFDLKSLNIDKYFIAIFVISGAIYSIYFWRSTGWAAALMAIILLILSTRKEYEFVSAETNLRRTIVMILIAFFLGLLLISDSFDINKFKEAVHYSITRIPFAAVEEVIFRGLFWMFLRNLNWSELKIVVSQAILFWLSHIYYMFTDAILFWLVVPALSILLGIIVWRAKSITPSALAHILFNLWWILGWPTF